MSEATETKPNYQFRIVYLMYVVAVMGVSLGMFQLWGIVPGLMILTFWAGVTFNNKPQIETFSTYLLAIFIGHLCLLSGPPHYDLVITAIVSFLLALTFLYFTRHLNKFSFVLIGLVFILYCQFLTLSNIQVRSVVSRFQCTNNLKQIALAVHNYHDVYNVFPPAFIADENGNPMHSWRVLLLPYMGHTALYNQYNFDEPWDGPSNIKLLKNMPDIYRCPTHNKHGYLPEDCTSYLAVTGETTVWPENKLISFSDITGGTSSTLLLTEFETKKIPWTKPEDMPLPEALEILSSVDPITYDKNHPDIQNTAFCDGSCHYVVNYMPKDFWSDLTNKEKFIPLDEDNYEQLPAPDPRPFWTTAAIVRLAAFLIVMLFPVPWVWRKANSYE